jgi:DNA polymerase-4
LLARTVGIKLRTADFKTHSRSRTLDVPTDQTKLITEVSHQLVAAVSAPGAIRLAGVRLENLVPRVGTPVQVPLDQLEAPDSEIDRVRDQIRRRFGGSSLTPGSLLP